MHVDDTPLHPTTEPLGTPARRTFRLLTDDGLELAGLEFLAGDVARRALDGGDAGVSPPAMAAIRSVRPTLLLHGGMAHSRWFDPLGPLLAAELRPVAIDRRGHGESDWTTPERYDWQRDIDDLRTAMCEVDPGPWILVGHSQGGLIAADMAARCLHPLAALVLLDVPLHPTGGKLRRAGEGFRRMPQIRWSSLEDAVRTFRPFPPQHFVPLDTLEPIARASFKPTEDGGWTSKFHWKVFQRDRGGKPNPLADFAEDLRRIDVPTLCVRGALSTILTPEDHHEMAARIPGAEAVEIPGTTHNLHAEAPEAVADAILDFVRRRLSTPATGGR